MNNLENPGLIQALEGCRPRQILHQVAYRQLKTAAAELQTQERLQGSQQPASYHDPATLKQECLCPEGR